MIPLRFDIFRKGYKVLPEVDGFDAVEFGEEEFGEGGARDFGGRVGARDVESGGGGRGGVLEDGASREEFDGFGVGRGFGLDEHVSFLRTVVGGGHFLIVGVAGVVIVSVGCNGHYAAPIMALLLLEPSRSCFWT